jgi:cytochrome bd ubiquinol oxidase subunit II
MRDYTTLQLVWFLLLSILWIGYFVLEGFDFGVGMLLRSLGHGNEQRRAMLHTIGPVWDGNEVWLVVAGAGTFAAFPEWYATLFSGFYLALVLILAALIVRGVAFEFWGKDDGPRWRTGWEWAVVVGSAVPALLWGVAWANIVAGVPIGRDHEFTGNLLDLLNPYALLGGVVTLMLFLSHGAVFLTLRLRGDMVDRARAVARRAAPAAALLMFAFLAWTIADQSDRGGVQIASVLCAIGAVAAAASVSVVLDRRAGLAFGLSAGAIALMFCALFIDLFPHAMVSSTSPAFDLTLNAAASTPYTLKVMTVAACLLLPVVLGYVAWSYWVFRHRVGPEDFDGVKTPLDLVDRRRPSPEG